MRSRAFQPRVYESEQESLFDGQPFDHMPRVFGSERQFPVLLVSFIGPQHGRVTYACVESGQHLVNRQSRLCRFERLADAPFELFAGFLLNKPCG